MSKSSSKRSRQNRAAAVRPTAVLGYELPVELSEKQIEADVAHYFGYLSASVGVFGHFRLLDVDEQITGADKSFVDGAVAYYLQFKKPCGLRPVSPAEASTPLRSNADPKQHIRRFRHAEELEQEPYSVCFHLHGKAKSASDFQHNILRQYERPPCSRAIYVCPLTLKHDHYVASMTQTTDFDYPFFYRDVQWIRDGAYVAHAARRIPYLRGHAAIVPHDAVTSADHHYSFSRHATDIAFHSPKRLASGPSRLSDFVGSEIERLIDPDSRSPLRELVVQLRQQAREWMGPEDSIVSDPNDDFGWLYGHGQLLYQRFGIRQMVALWFKPRK